VMIYDPQTYQHYRATAAATELRLFAHLSSSATRYTVVHKSSKSSSTSSLTMSCHDVMYVAVPSLTTLATTRCQSSLSSKAQMSCVGLALSFHSLSRYFSLTPLCPSVTTKFRSVALQTRLDLNICIARTCLFKYFLITFFSDSMISLTSSAGP